jgi:hypothetical protein
MCWAFFVSTDRASWASQLRTVGSSRWPVYASHQQQRAPNPVRTAAPVVVVLTNAGEGNPITCYLLVT